MKRKAEKTELYSITLTCLVISAIFVFGALFFALKKQEISEQENRLLAREPNFSWSSLYSGDAARESNLYVSDHFPARSAFVSAHALAELALGKREVNSVMLAKGGALCARKGRIEQETLSKNAEAITDFLLRERARGAKVCIGIIPDKADVFENRLPLFYTSENRKKLYSRTGELFPSISACNFADLFCGRGDEVYYKSDHHWNGDGAYEAYLEICRALEITPFPRESFYFEEVCNDFYGTDAARFGLRTSRDVIKLPRFAGDGSFVRHTDQEEKIGFYEVEKLSGTDKYGVFLGGNTPIVSITLADRAQSVIRPTMLVFRDSYTSALSPYLARHFNLVLCDSRYSKDFACDIAERAQAKYVLVLLGVDGIARSDVSAFFEVP